MKYLRYIKLFFSLVFGKNWYQGVDKPNWKQFLWQWRISPKTAHEVARQIWLTDIKPPVNKPE